MATESTTPLVPSQIEQQGTMKMATDPVCGMKVAEANAAAKSNYNGQTF
jgi:hypothetical protein